MAGRSRGSARSPCDRVTVIVLAKSDEAKQAVFAELVAEKFLPASQVKQLQEGQLLRSTGRKGQTQLANAPSLRV